MTSKGKISEEILHKSSQSFPGIKTLFTFMGIATNATNMVTRLPVAENMTETLKSEVCFLFKFNVTTVTIMDTLQKNAHKFGGGVERKARKKSLAHFLIK